MLFSILWFQETPMIKRATLQVLALPLTTALFLALVATAPVAASDNETSPTYLQEVKPLLDQNCVSCHRAEGTNLGGMIAPMSLATYDEVRPWARSIAKAVKSGDMPPWHAAAQHHGTFRNERSLEPKAVETILKWVEQGALKGSGDDVPRQFATTPGGWSIGEPDLIVEMPEPYRIGDEVEDIYVDIEVPVPPELRDRDRFIQAIEFKAGSKAVHHLIAYSLEPGASKIDAGSMLGGIAPGSDADRFPPGYARLWKKGSRLVFEMHYNKEPGAGTAVSDRSVMALRFADEPVRHVVQNDNISEYAFEIPAGAGAHEVRAAYEVKKDIQILSLLPHMHLRGKNARYLATYPNGTQELLLDVPHYDFDWQTSYYFAEPKPVPAGTLLEVVMQYDNSAANPDNPDPTRAVRYGEPTTDEMMSGFLNFTNQEPDDFDLEGPMTTIDWTDFGDGE